MPVESPFDHITDLNASNPLETDDVAKGAEHIRGLKTVLLTDFPNINAEVGCTPTELNFNDGATAGTLVASKTVVAAADKSIDLDSGALTNVNIDTGNIAAAVVLADGISATTQPTTTDNTELATTAFVQQELATLPVHSGTNFTGTGTAELGEATNIPTTANQVICTFKSLSGTTTGIIELWLGDSSYAYGTSVVKIDGWNERTDGAVEIIDNSPGGDEDLSGTIIFTRIAGTNQWQVTGNAKSGAANPRVAGGYIETTGATDRIKISITAGTFDAGVASVYWL